ncbi:VWA domain-containing protein [Aureimonas altamirensis]|uniref:vWA domain-containing protein n=1 Tax=Aureimonas altamirensis TaxID=370622 RepID=UPI0020375435|nr:vWA domain-containing protein [Aureimonas altamirensis]MCM2504627.1 VWA domain-containing protein [Aureimonas altamirensis]
MIPLAFDRPEILIALPMALLPFLLSLLHPVSVPQTAIAPADTLSRIVAAALRALAALAIAALLVGLAGLKRTDMQEARTGLGAHLVLLLDRSSSMDNTFANRRPDGTEESKATAARRLLAEFVRGRAQDKVGVVAFSTAPMLAVPLTDRMDTVHAAIAAMDEPGLTQTNVGRGLAMALSLFDDEPATASRAVVLVSDGAGVISRDVQEELTDMVARQPVNLYWLFLRTEGSKGIFEPPARGEMDTPQVRPERHLDLFLRRLGVPYRAFEAENPDAVAAAIAEIDRLEARPLTYLATIPQKSLAPLAYGVAALSLALLALAKAVERSPFPGRPLPPFRAEDTA